MKSNRALYPEGYNAKSATSISPFLLFANVPAERRITVFDADKPHSSAVSSQVFERRQIGGS